MRAKINFGNYPCCVSVIPSRRNGYWLMRGVFNFASMFQWPAAIVPDPFSVGGEWGRHRAEPVPYARESSQVFVQANQCEQL